VLAKLARQQHGGEAALLQIGVQAARLLARVAEDDGAGRVDIAQQVDDHVVDLLRHDAHDAMFDVGVAALGAGDLNAQSASR
jgi:hypothetical protein